MPFINAQKVFGQTLLSLYEFYQLCIRRFDCSLHENFERWMRWHLSLAYLCDMVFILTHIWISLVSWYLRYYICIYIYWCMCYSLTLSFFNYMLVNPMICKQICSLHLHLWKGKFWFKLGQGKYILCADSFIKTL